MTDVNHRHALLLPAEMAWVDQQAVQQGIPAFKLMDSAGRAVVEQITRRWAPCAVSVLCGPGNNGGDGFVIARLLREQGWPVRVSLLGELSQFKGEARQHAELWGGPLDAATPDSINGAGLIVDALFGTGLSRPLDGLALELALTLNDCDIPVCSVDIPSGVDGGTGRVLGAAVRADLTVSFHRKKPGQLMMPGRLYCGELIVADIGIPDEIVPGMTIQAHENHPDLWLDHFPWPRLDDHKYKRGHVLIRGGDVMTGAARLAASAAARVGAGLVSVATSENSWSVYAAALTSAIVLPCNTLHDWQELLSDPRRNVVLVGPGAGVSQALRDDVLATLEGGSRTAVLDADALTAFAGQGEKLFQAIKGPCVMTPHGGEFDRLFGDGPGSRDADETHGQPDGQPNLSENKLDRARSAAHISGAVVVLKGADTIVAAPDGRVIVNSNAPPELATGGTGDVLAGMISGLVAQGMDTFHASAAGVWMHGKAAALFGPGLIAEDLPMMLTRVMRELRDRAHHG